MDSMQALIAALTPQGMSPNQTPSQAAVAAATGGGAPGRYGEGYSPAQGAPAPEDPPPRVSKEAAQMLFQAHETVKAENPELARVLWTRIQPLTGDF